MKLQDIDIDRVIVSGTAFQAERRAQRSAGDVEALSASIREDGIIQPLVVRVLPLEPLLAAGDVRVAGLKDSPWVSEVYEVVAGEGRYLGALGADLEVVPAVVREDLSEAQVVSLQMVENFQRHEVDPLTEAVGYDELRSIHGMGLVEIGEAMGFKKSRVGRVLKLLELDESVRAAMRAGRIYTRVALALMRVPVESRGEALAAVAGEAEGSDPMSERAGLEWLRVQYLEPLEARREWDDLDRGVLEVAYPGAEAIRVLDFDTCGEWWPRGNEMPIFASPWWPYEAGLPEREAHAVDGAVRSFGEALVWMDLSGAGGLDEVIIARSGSGEAVRVVDRKAVLEGLKNQAAGRGGDGSSELGDGGLGSVAGAGAGGSSAGAGAGAEVVVPPVKFDRAGFEERVQGLLALARGCPDGWRDDPGLMREVLLELVPEEWHEEAGSIEGPEQALGLFAAVLLWDIEDVALLERLEGLWTEGGAA